jgi:chromosome segregation ATPase
MIRLRTLQADRVELSRKLEAAKAAAASQSGRTRAVARQLAELQTQYAAVAQLRDRYAEMEAQLAGAAGNDPARLVSELSETREALSTLQDESGSLRDQLAEARAQLADPITTEWGQRLIWLTAGLLVMMSLLLVMVTSWVH